MVCGGDRGHKVRKEAWKSLSLDTGLSCSPVHRTGDPRARSRLGLHHVCAQVNAEDGHGAQRQGDVGDDEEQEGGDLGDVARQRVRGAFLQVVKDEAACGGPSTSCEKPCRGTPPTSQSLDRDHYKAVSWSKKGSGGPRPRGPQFCFHMV